MGVQQTGSLPTDSAARLMIGIKDGMHMAGRTLVKHVQDGMRSGPKSGRIYGGHQASAPSEYSAIVTGDLLRSIDYRTSGADQLIFFATSAHAGYQEYGTWKMAARKNLGKAIEESDSEVRHLIELCVRSALGV
jgi:hypothetical protein